MSDESTRAKLLLAVDEKECLFMEATGKHQNMFRTVYTLFFGMIPEGHQIKSRCHNKECVNPRHLYPFDHSNPKHRLEEHIEHKENGCIEWVGHKNSQGYGRIQVNHKDIRTHRLAYELANGPIPEGMVVRHKCDNPSCINPAHLEIGTQQENIRDRGERGRTFVHAGETTPNSKLTNKDVLYILQSSDNNTFLGKKFGVNSSTILAIKRRKTWRHIGKAE